MKKLVKNNVSWVGYVDWELETFHGDEYSILNGSSQNAYLIQEEKNVLIDTVWEPHKFEFVESLKKAIDLKDIDYIVVNHTEQDHSGAVAELMKEIPETPIYCTANAAKFLEAQYGKHGWNFNIVKTGDSLDIGNGKKLVFVEMKFLHWPDSMATYMTGDNILFSNDAFGQHIAVEELFVDRADKAVIFREALRYYANILTPFSKLVSKKIEEIVAMNIPIDMIAPSHGAIWRENPLEIVESYAKWADSYKEDQITIVYDTMWEGTAKLAHELAKEISALNTDTIVKVFCISKSDKNEIMYEVFKSKAVAVGSPTCLNNILQSVSGWLTFLKQLKFSNKVGAAFGCYGWSGESVKIIKERLADAGFKVIDEEVKSYFTPEEQDLMKVREMAKVLVNVE
ncbi:MAG: MBL fold metallo-hydrolase [Tissierellia bacterium]|nr:MBL fold metallo-hydrolase [Tissierellia bacterium]